MIPQALDVTGEGPGFYQPTENGALLEIKRENIFPLYDVIKAVRTKSLKISRYR